MAACVSALGALPISTFRATSNDRFTSSMTSSSGWSMLMGMLTWAHYVWPVSQNTATELFSGSRK